MRNTARDPSIGQPMVYAFVIARPGTAIASLRRVRQVNTIARSEQAARAALAPLPLVFTGRYPVGGAA